ncbi:MAG: FAD-dependent monooxygenase, partial [Proteobacteria bacterium]|nr:FAD-dependent monooxygenase [Pseudomonadota bacterium]
KRFSIIGDAAVGMHPVTAHGFNLGLRGAKTLAKEIIMALDAKTDFAAQKVLERYSRRHRHVAAPLFHGTNAIVTLYTRDHRPARFARDVLLKVGNRFKPLKRVIMNQLTEI